VNQTKHQLAIKSRAKIESLGGPIRFTDRSFSWPSPCFILVAVFFYSSFFTNYPKGVADAFRTLNLWRQRTHEHEHAWYQYAYWLLLEEGVLLILAWLGALVALVRADNRLGLVSGVVVIWVVDCVFDRGHVG
jgi:Na+/H+ antiporter NhaC